MPVDSWRRISDRNTDGVLRPTDASERRIEAPGTSDALAEQTHPSITAVEERRLRPESRNAEEVLPGCRFAQYSIHSLLGRGGMGEVYRAHDEKLGRDVAIKILPAARLADLEQRSRFDQEARVLAALNHPHIAAIYGVDDSAGIRALVLELVEGPTLAERIAHGPLPIREALAIAAQVAEALEAAHEKGIVHRDLKPANVKVTAGGIVKVLDFGLAKAMQDVEGAVLPPSEMFEGMILGTAAYMSPEQASGRPVDKRTDIWAFGCVLYEMLTGNQVFHGRTLSDIMTAVLEREPDWNALPVGTPPDIRHLMERCLQKDPHERLRDIGDARIDVQEAVEALRSNASGSHPGPVTSRRPRRLWLSAAAAIAPFSLVAAGLAYWASRGPQEAALVGHPRLLTAGTGWHGDPALSPDGSFIAYSSNESGSVEIWIVDTQGGNPLRVTAGEGTHRQPAWFPDGSAVAFVLKQGKREDIWKVPRLGGTATQLVADATDPAISPDGSLMAFTRVGPSGFDRIAVAPMDRTDRARFITTDLDGLWDHGGPAWSPDGRWICYAAQNDLWLVGLDGGRPWRLTTDNEYDREPIWSADGRYVYFASFREGTDALWRVPAGGGRPVRVTLGTGPEQQPSVSRDGRRLAYSTLSSRSDIVLLDLHTGSKLELGGERLEYMPALAPDLSAVAFASDRWSDRLDLWMQPLVNYAPLGQATRLTDHPGHANYPTYSPDGRWIAYGRADEDRRDIWIIAARGGPPTRITEGAGEKIHPSWSPDGSTLAYGIQRDGVRQIQIVSVSQGRRVGIAKTLATGPALCMSPAWSPDGSQIAYVSSREIWVVGTDGTRPPRRLAATRGVERVRWVRGTGRLYASGFWDGDDVTIRVVDPVTGSTVPLPFPAVLGRSEEHVDFDVSADERLVAFSLEGLKGAIWVVEDIPRD